MFERGLEPPVTGNHPRIGYEEPESPRNTRDEGWARSLKDDINNETTAGGSTHGPLGLQRLSDLTIGQRRVGDFFDRHCRSREDRGEESPCACVFPTPFYKRVVPGQPEI